MAASTTEERVRLAAVRLFAARGFEATGIRQIADEAGISLASLYHYMTSKQDLLISIMVTGMRQMTVDAVNALKQYDLADEQLAALVDNHVVAHIRGPMQATVIDNEVRALQGQQRDFIISLRDEYETIWRDVLADGVATGRFHIPDLPLTRLAMMEMCNGVERWYSPGGRRSPEEIRRIFVELTLTMAGVPQDRVLTIAALPRDPDASPQTADSAGSNDRTLTKHAR